MLLLSEVLALASPYAHVHPTHHLLVQTLRGYELRLLDREGVTIEPVCGCDDRRRCNNPDCMMEAEFLLREMRREYEFGRLDGHVMIVETDQFEALVDAADLLRSERRESCH